MHKSTMTPIAPPQFQSEPKVGELLIEQQSNVRAYERTITNLDIEKITEKWQWLRNIASHWGYVV